MRSITTLIVIALLGTGAVVVLAGGRQCGAPSAGPSKATVGAACRVEPTATLVNARGNLTGRFDTSMSGVCRFGCATKLRFDARDVLAQPGARDGRLTQCPVSGVVFGADAGRPHVKIAGADYRTCCDRCAQKLKRDPKRYLRV